MEGRVPLESFPGAGKLSALKDGQFLSRRQFLCKRVLDLGLSVMALVIFFPFGTLIAVFIKLSSEGPIFYSQTRITQGGRLFTLYKFRTMRVNADEPQGTMSTKENDLRIYPYGRFLRRYHLDEFPQFWNVIKGDISIVGPRAEYIKTLEIAKKYYPEFKYRELVPAGITGWAQIRQGYVDQTEDYRIKLEHDLYYILNYSFWMDLRIIFLTALAFFRLRGLGT